MFSQIYLSKSHFCSFIISNISKSLTGTHLSWATWAICSRLLICLERPERFAHSRLIVLSNLSKSLTVAHLIWGKWANERIPSPDKNNNKVNIFTKMPVLEGKKLSKKETQDWSEIWFLSNKSQMRMTVENPEVGEKFFLTLKSSDIVPTLMWRIGKFFPSILLWAPTLSRGVKQKTCYIWILKSSLCSEILQICIANIYKHIPKKYYLDLEKRILKYFTSLVFLLHNLLNSPL